jgi:predicted nuclease of predicted toxin-antitoxin system
VLRLASDEDLDARVVRGLLERRPDYDIVDVREAGLGAAPDPEVLEWAAAEGRVLLTHDRNTMTRHAYDRVRAGQAMPGVLLISRDMPIGQAIDELLLMLECGEPGEWEGLVTYFPL